MAKIISTIVKVDCGWIYILAQGVGRIGNIY